MCWPAMDKKMNRDKAIRLARDAGLTTALDALTLVNSLEALGVLKFDEAPVEERNPPSHPSLMQPHTPVGELRALRAGPAEVLARVTLGPDYKVRGWRPGSGQPAESMWLVGPGADGADRIIDALKAAGYRIVRPYTGPAAPENYEFIAIESEG